MELIELACEDAHMTREEFIRTYADIEAYTSCDDEGDDFHQCDFFDQFLGPTKWLHLTPEAQGKIDDIHFRIWKDVWSHPTPAVDLADKVSNECLRWVLSLFISCYAAIVSHIWTHNSVSCVIHISRYFEEFMLEPRTNAKCPTDRPVIRVKVVPATYGLEGFEDAVWEATEDLMKCSANTFGNADHESSAEECCKAITFVAAAPDIFADPNLMEVGLSSPQAEFEPDRFRVFSSTLREKIVLFSRMEDVPLDDAVQLTAFHPLWKLGDNFDSGSNYGVEVGGRKALQSFPYPCIAVSTDINV